MVVVAACEPAVARLVPQSDTLVFGVLLSKLGTTFNPAVKFDLNQSGAPPVRADSATALFYECDPSGLVDDSPPGTPGFLGHDPTKLETDIPNPGEILRLNEGEWELAARSDVEASAMDSFGTYELKYSIDDLTATSEPVLVLTSLRELIVFGGGADGRRVLRWGDDGALLGDTDLVDCSARAATEGTDGRIWIVDDTNLYVWTRDGLCRQLTAFDPDNGVTNLLRSGEISIAATEQSVGLLGRRAFAVAVKGETSFEAPRHVFTNTNVTSPRIVTDGRRFVFAGVGRSSATASVADDHLDLGKRYAADSKNLAIALPPALTNYERAFDVAVFAEDKSDFSGVVYGTRRGLYKRLDQTSTGTLAMIGDPIEKGVKAMCAMDGVMLAVDGNGNWREVSRSDRLYTVPDRRTVCEQTRLRCSGNMVAIACLNSQKWEIQVWERTAKSCPVPVPAN